jgi:hypothetical protein
LYWPVTSPNFALIGSQSTLAEVAQRYLDRFPVPQRRSSAMILVCGVWCEPRAFASGRVAVKRIDRLCQTSLVRGAAWQCVTFEFAFALYARLLTNLRNVFGLDLFRIPRVPPVPSPTRAAGVQSTSARRMIKMPHSISFASSVAADTTHGRRSPGFRVALYREKRFPRPRQMRNLCRRQAAALLSTPRKHLAGCQNRRPTM